MPPADQPENTAREKGSSSFRAIDRKYRVVDALENAEIPYALTGGHAVEWWVGTINEGATRLVSRVEVVIRPEDLSRACGVIEQFGFEYVGDRAKGLASVANHFFVDTSIKRRAPLVEVYLSGEWARGNQCLRPVPRIADEESAGNGYCVLNLEGLVTMLLSHYQRHDRVGLHDLLDVGLIDETWLNRFPETIGERLKEILNSPDQGAYYPGGCGN